MIADLPALVVLSYGTLTSSGQVVEVQKDILHQAMRSAFPKVEAFLEQEDVEKTHVTLDCVRCSVPSKNAVLKAESIVFESNEIRNQTQLKFSVGDEESGLIEKWVVNVKIQPPRFFISTLNNLLKDMQLNRSQFRVQACQMQRSCPAFIFSSEKEAHQYLDSLEGYLAAKNVESEQTLLPSYVKRKLDIERNKTITIKIETESGLSLVTSGIAQENGFKGDKIKVSLKGNNTILSPSATKTIEANVTGPNEVEYEIH